MIYETFDWNCINNDGGLNDGDFTYHACDDLEYININGDFSIIENELTDVSQGEINVNIKWNINNNDSDMCKTLCSLMDYFDNDILDSTLTI